jgi:serine protease Do
VGYYDDHNDSAESARRQKRRRGGWFWAGFLGAIIGVIITFIASPALARYGILPGGETASAPNEQVDHAQQNAGPTEHKTVNVSVNSASEKAVNKAFDAVVGVINYQSSDFFSNGSDGQPKSLGSGVIYKKQDGKAYIVTNNHVVEGATKLEVSFDNDSKVPASLVGTDPLMDLAVLTINADKVKKVAQLGNSSKLRRGEPVVAIGNPLGFSGTVTQGVVSATNRTVPRDSDGDGQPDWNAQVIQTDAAINPGNSGGALINLDGQVVGINSMKIAEQSVEGIGFAIPINVAEPIMKQIEKYGKVTRPYIGIYYQPLSQFPDEYKSKLFNLPKSVKDGIVVRSIVSGGPADRAGLRPQDVIVSMDGHKIKDSLDFKKYLDTKYKPGDEAKLTVYRNGKKMSTTIKLGRSS